MTKTQEQELTELRRVEIVSKALQALTITLIAVSGFFLVRTYTLLDRVVDKIHDLEIRVTVLEHDNDR